MGLTFSMSIMRSSLPQLARASSLGMPHCDLWSHLHRRNLHRGSSTPTFHHLHRIQHLLLFCNKSRDFFHSRIGAELSLFAIRNTGKQIERPSYCHGQAAISGDPSFIVFNDVALLGDQWRGRKKQQLKENEWCKSFQKANRRKDTRANYSKIKWHILWLFKVRVAAVQDIPNSRDAVYWKIVILIVDTKVLDTAQLQFF